MDFWVSESSARSSAKFISTSCENTFHWIPVRWYYVDIFIIQCMATRKSSGDSKQPNSNMEAFWNVYIKDDMTSETFVHVLFIRMTHFAGKNRASGASIELSYLYYRMIF